jgi:hypothetical protein
VFGQTPLGTKVSAKGFDGVDGFCVHNLTLTRPDAFSKDIDAGAVRVLAFHSLPLGLSPGNLLGFHPAALFTQ